MAPQSIPPLFSYDVAFECTPIELGHNLNFSINRPLHRRSPKTSKTSETSPTLWPLSSSEMLSCVVFDDHSDCNAPRCAILEKRRRLSNVVALEACETAAVLNNSCHRSTAPQHTIKPEPDSSDSLGFSRCSYSTMGSAPCSRESQEQDAASLLQSHMARSPEFHQEQHYRQHQQQKQLMQRQHKQYDMARIDYQQTARRKRSDIPDITQQTSSSSFTTRTWMPPFSPSFPPPVSGDAQTRAQIHLRSGPPAHISGGISSSMAWSAGAMTITTGIGDGAWAATGPGVVTTGVVTSKSPHICSPAVVSGMPGSGPSSVTGAVVVTGCRPSMEHKRKRSASAAPCSDASSPCAAPRSSVPAGPPVLSSPPLPTASSSSSFAAAAAAAPSSPTLTFTSASAASIPARSPTIATKQSPVPAPRVEMIHGSTALPSQRSPTESELASFGRVAYPVHEMPSLEDASAPSTPPRTPGDRVMPLAVLRQLSRAAGSHPVALTASSSGLPVPPPQQLQGFQMLGVEQSKGPHPGIPFPVAAGPAAGCGTKGQIVHVVLRLSPLGHSSLQQIPLSATLAHAALQHVQADAAAWVPAVEEHQCAEPSCTAEQSLYGARQCSEEWCGSMDVEVLAPEMPEQQQDWQERQQEQEWQKQQHEQELQQQDREEWQQQERELTADPASELQDEPGMLPAFWSSEGQLPSGVACGWLPPNTALELALPALDRLLSAATAAATAAADVAEPYTSSNSPSLPSLVVPRPDPAAYFEPDGTLLRGGALQSACNLIRLAKLLRGGFSISLPWCEPDGATSNASVRAAGAGATSVRAAGAGTTSVPAAGAGATSVGVGSSSSIGVVGKLGTGPIGVHQSIIAAAAASGRRLVPLVNVLNALADFGGAARALQRAEARSAIAAATASSSAGQAAVSVLEYKALWPLMRRGRRCAEAVMARVERVLTGGDEVGPLSLSPTASANSA